MVTQKLSKLVLGFALLTSALTQCGVNGASSSSSSSNDVTSEVTRQICISIARQTADAVALELARGMMPTEEDAQLIAPNIAENIFADIRRQQEEAIAAQAGNAVEQQEEQRQVGPQTEDQANAQTVDQKTTAGDEDQDENCAICMDPLNPADAEHLRALPCGHTFHTVCIQDWEQNCQNRNVPFTCPTCRNV